MKKVSSHSLSRNLSPNARRNHTLRGKFLKTDHSAYSNDHSSKDHATVHFMEDFARTKDKVKDSKYVVGTDYINK